MQIAVKLGTTAVAAAKKFLPQATLSMFENEPQTYQELRNGNVHAVVGTAPRPAYEALHYSETLFLPVKDTFTKEPIGFALRKGDPDSLAFFNMDHRYDLTAGWRNGTITGLAPKTGSTRSNNANSHQLYTSPVSSLCTLPPEDGSVHLSPAYRQTTNPPYHARHLPGHRSGGFLPFVLYRLFFALNYQLELVGYSHLPVSF